MKRGIIFIFLLCTIILSSSFFVSASWWDKITGNVINSQTSCQDYQIIYDPANDIDSSFSGSLDLIEGSIQNTNTQLIFSIKTRGDITPEYSNPANIPTGYKWIIDTDLNSNTGEQNNYNNNQIGNEYNIKVLWDSVNEKWFSVVDKIGGDSFGVSNFKVVGNTAQVTINKSLIGNPSDFIWAFEVETQNKPNDKGVVGHFNSQNAENCNLDKCSDGTANGKCSEDKPNICNSGELETKCSVCGCLSDEKCLPDSVCIKNFCSNGIKDSDEEGVDCGNVCLNTCETSTNCPNNSTIRINDSIDSNIPGLADVKSVELTKLKDSVLLKVNVRGPYEYLPDHIVFDFDTNEDSIFQRSFDVHWMFPWTFAAIKQYDQNDNELPGEEKVPVIFHDNNYYVFIPLKYFSTNSFDFQFRSSGDGWADLGGPYQATLSDTNYKIPSSSNLINLPSGAFKKIIDNKTYYNLPLETTIQMNSNAFITNPASYVTISQNSILFKPDYSDYHGEIFQFAKSDNCGFPALEDNTYYIPGDSFLGDYVYFFIPSDYIPASSNSPESNYNQTLKYLMDSTDSILIHDKGFEILRELTNVNLDGALIMFDYSVGGGAFVMDHIIKNGPFAFENGGVPEYGGNFHEISHFHTLSNSYFTNTYPDAMYYEGFANALAHYTKQKLVDNYQTYGLTENDRQLLLDDYYQWINNFDCLTHLKNNGDFQTYLNNGDGCIVQEAMINLSNQYGSLDLIDNLMEIYNPLKENSLLSIKHNTEEENTLFVASLSVAYGEDLRDYFLELSWPINDTYFEYVYPILSAQLNKKQTKTLTTDTYSTDSSGIYCNGCSLDGKCYNLGYRKLGQFCSENNQFVNQKDADEICDNNFECSSNLCIDGKCVSSGLWQKFLSWLQKLFG